MKFIFITLIIFFTSSYGFTQFSGNFNNTNADIVNDEEYQFSITGDDTKNIEGLFSILHSIDYENLNKGAIIDKEITIVTPYSYEYKRIVTYEITREDNNSPMLIKIWLKEPSSETTLIRGEIFESRTEQNPFGEIRMDIATINIPYENATNIDFTQDFVTLSAIESKILDDKNTLSYRVNGSQNASTNMYIEITRNFDYNTIVKYNYITQTSSTIIKTHFTGNKFYYQLKNYTHDSNGTYVTQTKNTVYSNLLKESETVENMDLLLYDYTTGERLNKKDFNSSNNFHCHFGDEGLKHLNLEYPDDSGEVYVGFSFDKNSFNDVNNFYKVFYHTLELECNFYGFERALYFLQKVAIHLEPTIRQEEFLESKLIEDQDSYYPIVSEDNIKSIGNKPE